MEEIKELAKCVKCNEFSEVDTDIALMSNPPQYQFTCSSCSNKQFIWGSFIYRIPRSILAKAEEYEAKAKAWERVYEAFEKAKNEHEFSNGVCTVMNEYENGEYDAKK